MQAAATVAVAETLAADEAKRVLERDVERIAGELREALRVAIEAGVPSATAFDVVITVTAQTLRVR